MPHGSHRDDPRLGEAATLLARLASRWQNLDAEERHRRLIVARTLLCVAAGMVTLFAAYLWPIACQEGTDELCRGGVPSFALVFQPLLAGASCAATVVSRLLVERRSYAPARVALAVAWLLFGGWMLVLVTAISG
jgi:hypothetical protein